MLPIHIFAGFGPKDLMFFLYVPAFVLIAVGSVVLVIIKGRGRPYALTFYPFPPLAIGWYLIDRFKNKVDFSQSIILAGAIIVSLVLALASSSIVPENSGAVNLMALIGTISAIVSLFFAIKHRKR